MFANSEIRSAVNADVAFSDEQVQSLQAKLGALVRALVEVDDELSQHKLSEGSWKLLHVAVENARRAARAQLTSSTSSSSVRYAKALRGGSIKAQFPTTSAHSAAQSPLLRAFLGSAHTPAPRAGEGSQARSKEVNAEEAHDS
jgi:hypothetical protein